MICAHLDCSNSFEQKPRGRTRLYCDDHSKTGPVEAFYARKYGGGEELRAELASAERLIVKLERELAEARAQNARLREPIEARNNMYGRS